MNDEYIYSYEIFNVSAIRFSPNLQFDNIKVWIALKLFTVDTELDLPGFLPSRIENLLLLKEGTQFLKMIYER